MTNVVMSEKKGSRMKASITTVEGLALKVSQSVFISILLYLSGRRSSRFKVLYMMNVAMTEKNGSRLADSIATVEGLALKVSQSVLISILLYSSGRRRSRFKVPYMTNVVMTKKNGTRRLTDSITTVEGLALKVSQSVFISILLYFSG
jgi:uncharacterized membrane-anchored protein